MTTILGIETSCDETSAAVVVDGRRVLSNLVSSQVDLHAKYGGVVPEIAARAHIESLDAIVEALRDEQHATRRRLAPEHARRRQHRTRVALGHAARRRPALERGILRQAPRNEPGDESGALPADHALER